MKVSIAVATLLIYCPLLMSQEGGPPIPYVDTTSSQNHQYELIVRGTSYEDGRTGPQKISLHRSNGTKLWSKASDGSGFMPIVSNRGDVTVCKDFKLIIFDKKGSTKGTCDLSPRGYLTDDSNTDDFNLLQSFSPNAKYYYILLGSPDSVWLLVLSDSAKELHRESLGAFHPRRNNLLVYKDKVIAFDSFPWSDPDYKERCCAFDKLGTLIWEYDQQATGGESWKWIVKFDQRKGILTVTDGANKNVFDVNTLE
jgi:hypothetical protein